MPTLYQSVSTTRPFAPGAGAPTATPGPIPAHRLFADSEPREHAPSVGAPPPGARAPTTTQGPIPVQPLSSRDPATTGACLVCRSTAPGANGWAACSYCL